MRPTGCRTLLAGSAIVAIGLSIVLLAQTEEAVPQKTIPVYTYQPTTPPGTYWSLQYMSSKVPYPPLPFCPFPELTIYEVDPTNHMYIFDDTMVD